MPKAIRVTVTLPADVLAGIERFEDNRSLFISEAVTHELIRRRRRDLLRSIQNPHPKAADAAIAPIDRAAGLAAGADGLVDPRAGTPVRWVEGLGWVAEPK